MMREVALPMYSSSLGREDNRANNVCRVVEIARAGRIWLR